MHPSQAFKKSTWVDSLASPPFSFHVEIENPPIKGNPKVTKKITKEADLTEKKYDFYSPILPYHLPNHDDYTVLPRDCYYDLNAASMIDFANLFCHEEVALETISDCPTIKAMGVDCLIDVFSKDVVERYHCNKDLYLIKYRALRVWYICMPQYA
ncbi:gastrin-releasing peptide receptor [Striga asiatica]|uniref:Gastrin-releasing peptide receptor n=1 Tax=Striga asiatica TaxID=4170 RepID=A0A5A7QT47_STRAF|nr:gastrin-releasing peptide receptor [Striga asiatica]